MKLVTVGLTITEGKGRKPNFERKEKPATFPKNLAGCIKKQAEYRTATTTYPCCGQALGEFSRSWSYRLAGANVQKFLIVKTPA